eukprot:2977313-Rhodomonas_salina.2
MTPSGYMVSQLCASSNLYRPLRTGRVVWKARVSWSGLCAQSQAPGASTRWGVPGACTDRVGVVWGMLSSYSERRGWCSYGRDLCVPSCAESRDGSGKIMPLPEDAPSLSSLGQ